ncbi:unnamed protein product [Dibothriocephalus latus]|uniref:Uncharacterized protein n=1 Tax=Dibothriocephalus latus TaxID=60516 RepID=A0A3P7N5V3_DIBLA|nr:unnamed protein product [Dibothriocephalus latus]
MFLAVALLRSVCDSKSKWCEKAADNRRDVFDVRDRSPNFGVRATLSDISFAQAPVDEFARIAIFTEHSSKVLYLGNFIFWFTAVRLNTPIERPYATAFVADWVVAVVIQYLNRATTIFTTDEDIKEGQLAVLFFLHRKLDVREDAIETLLKREHLIPFDDGEGVIHIPCRVVFYFSITS